MHAYYGRVKFPSEIPPYVSVYILIGSRQDDGAVDGLGSDISEAKMNLLDVKYPIYSMIDFMGKARGKLYNLCLYLIKAMHAMGYVVT